MNELKLPGSRWQWKDFGGRSIECCPFLLLTPSDKLRALSALASKIRKDETRSDQYVARPWKSDLDFELLRR